MTGHQINSLVGDLVAMAQAMDKLPQVELERDAAKDHVEALRQTVQDREVSILNLKAELEAKNEAIRNLEVAKDAAETMFLEADDRTQRAVDFIKAQFGAAGSLIQALEPVRAMPETKPLAEPNPATFIGFEPQGQSESPLPVSSEAQSQTVGSTTEPIAAPTTSPSQAEGQSEPDPTQRTTESQKEGGHTMTNTIPIGEGSDDLEPQRYDDYGTTREAWNDWAERTGYWKAPIGSII